MPNEGPTEVGSIAAYLTLNTEDWTAKIDAAERRARDLGESSPDVRITVSAAEAEERLASVKRELAELSAPDIRLKMTDGAARAEIDELRAELDALDQHADIGVRANASIARTELDALAAEITAELDKAGAEAGDAFDRALRSRIEATARALPQIRPGVDASRAERELANIRAQLDALAVPGTDARVGVADDKARAKIAELQLRLAALTRNKDIRVRVDAAAASAELAKLRAELSATGKSADDAEKRGHALLTALLTIGPALIPMLGVAAGATAGLGAAAAVSLLGVLGVKDAMAQGTPVGREYAAAFAPLTAEFTSLKQIAAQGMFDGVDKGARSLTTLFPALNRDTAVLSSQMGDIAGRVAPGLVGLFSRLQPLILTIGTDIDRGAAGFEHWSTASPAVSRFVAYAQSELPAVERTIGSLSTTVSHLTQGFAPWGSTALTAIRLVSQAFNAIPIGVLQAAVPLIVGAATGFKMMSAASSAATGLSGMASKLTDIGGIAGKASGVVGSMGKAVGYLGPIAAVAGLGLGALSAIMGQNQKKAQENAAAANDLAHAIENGTTVEGLWNQAQKEGLDTSARTGLSQQQLISALTGTKAQYDAASAAIQRNAWAMDVAGKSTDDYNANTDKANKRAAQQQRILDDLAAQYAAARKQAADYATSQGDVALATSISSGAVDGTARALGMSVDQYLAAKLAADKNKQSIDAQTQSMVLENNAAGLLNQALQSLAGQNLSAAQAQTALDSATLSAISALKQNKGAMSESTQAGLADRQALEGVVSAMRSKMQADAQAGLSTKTVTEAYEANRKKLLDQIAAVYGAGSAVYKYADSISRIPPVKETAVDLRHDAEVKTRIAILQKDLDNLRQNKVPGVDIDTDAGKTRAAALQKEIDALRQGKQPSITVIDNASGILTKIQAHMQQLDGKRITTYIDTTQTIHTAGAAAGGTGGRVAMAAGGPVVGQGVKGVDSLVRLLAPGEYVVGDRAVDKWGLPAMDDLNAGRVPREWLAAAAGAPVTVGSNVPAPLPSGPEPPSQAAVPPPAVYVQNPFTGEYLLAQVAQIADARLGRAALRTRALVGRRG